jgi:hypothetical protein
MPHITKSQATTTIPVQLSGPEFIAFIFPHVWTSGNRGWEAETPHSAAVRALSLGSSHMEVPRWPDLLVWMFRKS